MSDPFKLPTPASSNTPLPAAASPETDAQDSSSEQDLAGQVDIASDRPDSLGRRLWWRFLHALCWIWMIVFYRLKTYGTQEIPLTGPLLLISNHQSYLDPIIVGIPLYRRSFYALARTTLFRHRLLGRLIRSLNAIPVQRNSADLAAMRVCIQVLKKGHALLIFPEGTRTLDGRTGTFSPGTALLIKRARPLVVPVAIAGSFGAWPKGRKLPRLIGRIGVTFGKPIPAEELLKLDAVQAMAHLQKNVEQLRLLTAARLD